jgi:hypothetical protein
MSEAGFGRLVSRRTTMKVAVISPINEDAINRWLERAGERGVEVLDIQLAAGYISRGKGGDIDAREKQDSAPSICLISYAEPAKE